MTRVKSRWVLFGVVMAALAMVAFTAGGAGGSPGINDACAGTGCHADKVADSNASIHRGLSCETCHPNATVHLADPTKTIKPQVRFDLEGCGRCHPNQYGTYVYGDDYATKYGGSPFEVPKTDTYANYNDIVDGHGFTKEYNEERSHNVMLKDHHDIKRGKFDVCLQCKSTKVTYYWDSGKTRTIMNTHTVKGGHMASPVTIPAGTTVRMATVRDVPPPHNHEVVVLVTLPTGEKYTTSVWAHPEAIDNAVMTWSALYALTVDGLPANSPSIDTGTQCNHCHDPHKVGRDAQGNPIGFRIIRSEQKWQIARKGLNPYNAASPKTFDGSKALNVESATALCGQCHVEYVCGKSGIDGINRDYFPWVKVGQLESLYASVFPPQPGQPGPYVQDWRHGTGPLSSLFWPANGIYYKTPFPISEPLIKSQHPEAELYWGSRHYNNGAMCYTCHMPTVKTKTGQVFTSHWMASPNKYMEPVPVQAFAAAFNLELSKDGIIVPCGTCHGGLLARMQRKAYSIQDGNFTMALNGQAALIEGLKAIKATKDAQAAGVRIDTAKLKLATDQYRSAHVRWENLAVSENSMGFHNPAEFSTEMKAVVTYATNAKNNAIAALPRTRK